MIEKLKKTLDILKILNKKKNILSQIEIKDQEENIEEFSSLVTNIDKINDLLTKTNPNDNDTIISLLIDLHIYYMDGKRTFHYMDELIKKIAGNYQSK